MKFNYIPIIKILITLGLLIFIWNKINIEEILMLLGLLDSIDWITMFIVITFVNFIAAFRWNLILNNLDINLPFNHYIKFFYLGNFLNQVLPTSTIGDGFRVWSLYKEGHSFKISFHGVIFDRIIPLTSLIIIIIFMLYPLFLLTNDFIIFYFSLGIIFFLIFIFFLLKLLLKISYKLSQFNLLTKFLSFLRELYVSFKLQLRNIIPIVLGIVGFCTMVIMITFIANKMSIELDVWTSLVLIPPVFLVMSIPISLAGWGTREYSMVIALSYVGISSEQALSISIAFGLITLMGTFPALIYSKYLFKNIKDM